MRATKKSFRKNVLAGLAFFTMLVLVLTYIKAQQPEVFERQRQTMVRLQIEARGITDRAVLAAMRKVQRHRFVSPAYIPRAYADHPLPIDDGQTISQPYIVAFMTEALTLQRTDKVLEIGTGSGYQAAVLAEICDSVFTIEIFENLGTKARKVFNELEYQNIFSKIGDGYQGWPEFAPFDAIIVTCSPTHIPQALKDQLAEEGRMIIPVGESTVQQLVLLKKRKGKIREKSVLPVRFVPMIDEGGEKY